MQTDNLKQRNFQSISRGKKDLEDEILIPSNRGALLSFTVLGTYPLVGSLNPSSLAEGGRDSPCGAPRCRTHCIPARIMNYIFLFHRSIDYNIFLLSIKSKRERKTARVGWHTLLPPPFVSRPAPLSGTHSTGWKKGLKNGEGGRRYGT